MDNKKCNKCLKIKPLDSFYNQKDTKDGKRSLCKDCIKSGVKSYKKCHKVVYVPRELEVEKISITEIEEPKVKLYNSSYLKRLYNITPEVYQKMIEESSGNCPICKVKFDDSIRATTPCVDHNHSCCSGSKTCGKCIRAIICFKCNMGLGFFEDNPNFLKSASEYLTNT